MPLAQGGVVIFAVGGVLLFLAYFLGLAWATTYLNPLLVLIDYVLAFLGFYLVGFGLWTIIHTAQTKT